MFFLFNQKKKFFGTRRLAFLYQMVLKFRSMEIPELYPCYDSSGRVKLFFFLCKFLPWTNLTYFGGVNVS